jgi:hypothetical protein
MQIKQALTTGRSELLLAIATVASVVFGACSSVGAQPATSANPAATADAASMSPAGDAWLVVGSRDTTGLEVVLASTREELYRLPAGVPNETWGELVAARPDERHRGNTLVDVVTVQPDLPARTRSLEGRWRLPQLGLDTLPVGVSSDRSTIVLVEDGAPAEPGTTRFAVVRNGKATRVIELKGSFEFDTLSPDGSILYVVEHLPAPPAGHYQVRAVDVATGLLRDGVIVDKRNVDASMGGWPITQLRHDNGMVFTLYRGTNHTFIHALNSIEAWAVCIGLPMVGAEDEAAAMDWGLGQAIDGRSVYAVNATLGLAVAIDPGELTVRASARFDLPRAAATISLAKFGHQKVGPVGRRVVVTPDGSTIYAAGPAGIVQLRSADLTMVGTVVEGAAVDALALSPDGASLYALLPAQGRIVKIDLASGQIAGSVPGDRFDRLVAIVPW